METKHYLSVDIGTTCCKAQLFDEKGDILFYRSQECPLATEDGETYVHIQYIVSAVKSLISDAAKHGKVSSVAFSSIGEAFVLLDKGDNLLTLPMLYTDARGHEQAARLGKQFGSEKLHKLTGVQPHAMYSISKLLWLKENRPDKYEKADKLLLICDYFGYLLTGKRQIDYCLAARTGVFDIRNKCFCKEILSAFDIPSRLFSDPKPTGSIVGTVLQKTAEELGLPHDCVVVLGSHDQVCTTLGAGAVNAGNAADGMGTVECITTLFESVPENAAFGKMGYPVIPFASGNLYCTYLWNSSCGSVINWLRKKIMHGYSGDEKDFFAYMEKNIGQTPARALLLPYFGGATTPYEDPHATGAFVNLTLGTTDTELYRAVLEGMAYEMKLNLQTVRDFGIHVQNVTATGGGANSDAWLQIKADICNVTVRTLRSEEGGLCGAAMLQAVALGSAHNLQEAADVFVRYNKTFLPNPTQSAAYEENYNRYKKLYALLKEVRIVKR